MVTGVIAARSLIFARCFQIAVARCIVIALLASRLSSLLIFASIGVRCMLFALHCSHFADDSMLRATFVLLFAVGYWIFASRCSVFVSRC